MTANPDCHRITLMWGAQVGKTQIQNCAIGYNIHQNPANQMMMQPSQGDLQTWLETKFTPMVESTPVLENRLAKPRSREGVNNNRMKSYPGGFLMFSWSGSAKTMRGRSAPKIYCDETDGYERTAEGHPVSLLWQRSATYGDQRCLFETSTPTLKGASHIEDAFEAGDKRRYFMPCPHCQEKITFQWSNVTWDKDEETGEHLPETAHYACQECGGVINDGQKLAMLRMGEWIGEKEFRGHASYHLSELYSAFRKWRDIAQSFLEKKAQNDLQTFTNVSLAETWEIEGDQVDQTGLLARRERYNATVPADGLVLTAGVDCQDDRLEMEVLAWSNGFESFGIDYKVIYGDPSQPEIWRDLDNALRASYEHESGTLLNIAATCIDSGGHHTQEIYDFCYQKFNRRIYPVKGVGGEGRPIVSAPTKRKYGKANKTIKLFSVGTDSAKNLLFSNLRISEPGPGYCHFPESYTEEYFSQLTAEKRVTKYRKGFAYQEYIKTRARNESLDIRVYNLAAITLLNPNFDAIRASLLPTEHTPEITEAEKPTTRAIRRKARRPGGGGFVNSWKK